MSTTRLLELYKSLREQTQLMAESAQKNDWTTFSALEASSVVLLSEVEGAFNLGALNAREKGEIVLHIQVILSLQETINSCASVWRQAQSQQLQSEAMAAKISDAYS